MKEKKERAHLIIRKYETENDKSRAFNYEVEAGGLDMLEMIAIAVDDLISRKHGRNYDHDDIVAACGAIAIMVHKMHYDSQQTFVPRNFVEEVLKNDGPAN